VSTNVVKTNDWGSGYCADVQVKNGSTTTQTWRVVVQIEGSIYTLWNAVWQQSGSSLTASGVSWNATLAPGATAQFGYCANR
jgi:endoglucanase